MGLPPLQGLVASATLPSSPLLCNSDSVPVALARSCKRAISFARSWSSCCCCDKGTRETPLPSLLLIDKKCSTHAWIEGWGLAWH